jgi:flagellar biosynthesis GTPase FlhF
MYFHPSASEGEKENSLAVFKRMCNTNNVDPDEYIKTCKHNPSRSRTSSRSYQSSDHEYDPFEDFFRNAGFDRASRARREQEARNQRAREAREREYQERAERARRERESREREARERREEEARRKAEWNRNQWRNLIFEMKEPMFETKIHNGKRVILMSTLAREFGTEKRFGIQNMCLYSDIFNADDFLKFDGKIIYKVECDKVQYFRDHYLIRTIWIVTPEGPEIQIYSSRGVG